MKNIKIITHLLFLTVFLFFSCAEEQEAKSVSVETARSDESLPTQPPSPPEKLLPAEIHCVATSQNKYCLVNKSEGPTTKIYSGPEVYLQKYVKADDQWKYESEYYIFKEEFYYCEFASDFEIATIDGTEYLYFVYRLSSMGNATDYTDLRFVLFSLKDLKQTVLLYGGYPVYGKDGKGDKVKGGYMNLASFTNKPDLLDFLQKKATASPMVYQYSEKDLDMCHPDNYKQRWALDNPDIDILMKKMKTSETPLRIAYYEQNIFPEKDGSITSTIENGNYKVVSLFRNDILAYDKTNKKYFPVWVDECSHGCDKSISFTSQNILEIIYSETNNEKIIVDLSTMIYKIP
jgi:hypothetical protein